MSPKLKIYLAQINPTVGDLEINAQKILHQFKLASEAGCDLVVFSEMAVCGYPCEDLWLKKYFISECREKIFEIVSATKNSQCAILLGAPTIDFERKKEIIRNSALLIERGEIKKIINKKTLPNFGVFDEHRYFKPAQFLSLVEFRELTLAILICEDLWPLKNLYLLQEQILDVVIVINASPYSSKKHEYRQRVTQNFVTNLNKPLIYVNQVGGQDSLVFDGSSFVINKAGEIVLRLKEFEEDSIQIELEKSGKISFPNQSTKHAETNSAQATRSTKHEARSTNYAACTLALHDYVHKNGFKKVLLGMSGGIDSALVAAIAVDALEKENVFLYALPSRYSSEESMIDAKNCAENLGVNLEVISIEPVFESMLSTVKNVSEVAKENMQSRIRGNILMAIANSTGALLLSTGNKSELACGYATIYGDMCGAFNPIKDLYKTEIYELAKLRAGVIPPNIFIKAPSAELRPDQKDSDSLPDYEILDQILFSLIEEQKSVEEISRFFDKDLVKKVAKLFYSSEYKRRQAVIGPKISDMSFDKDRRYPITNRFYK